MLPKNAAFRFEYIPNTVLIGLTALAILLATSSSPKRLASVLIDSTSELSLTAFNIQSAADIQLIISFVFFSILDFDYSIVDIFSAATPLLENMSIKPDLFRLLNNLSVDISSDPSLSNSIFPSQSIRVLTLLTMSVLFNVSTTVFILLIQSVILTTISLSFTDAVLLFVGTVPSVVDYSTNQLQMLVLVILVHSLLTASTIPNNSGSFLLKSMKLLISVLVTSYYPASLPNNGISLSLNITNLSKKLVFSQPVALSNKDSFLLVLFLS